MARGLGARLICVAAALLAVAVVAGGCVVMELPDVPFRCGEGGACPTGFECREDYCVQPGTEPPGGGAAGGGGSSDVCAGRTTGCSYCQIGGCDACVNADTCTGDCFGGQCEITCAGSATCNLVCVGGGCSYRCLEAADCDFDCIGGGCNFECATSGTCSTACGMGGCVGP